MVARPNRLLEPGAEGAWLRLEAEQRRAATRGRETVEQRLIRGQRLSTQAAGLRRSVREGGRRDTGS